MANMMYFFYKKLMVIRHLKNVWSAEWGGYIFYSHGWKHSRGVMTLMRLTVKVENTSTTSDRKGRFLSLIFQYRTKNFVSSIFKLPMTKIFRSNFIPDERESYSRRYVNSYLVLGDFICPFENIDKKRRKRHQQHEKCHPEHSRN